MNFKTLTALVLLSAGLIVSPAGAHEGHDHDAPTTLKAPKGGIIKALDESRVEVVYKGQDIKVYVYDRELKPAPTSEFKIVATAELPRTKQKDPVALTAKDTFFEGFYDAKKLHRYTLRLAVTDSKTGQTDDLTFTIEPRR